MPSSNQSILHQNVTLQNVHSENLIQNNAINTGINSAKSHNTGSSSFHGESVTGNAGWSMTYQSSMNSNSRGIQRYFWSKTKNVEIMPDLYISSWI